MTQAISGSRMLVLISRFSFIIVITLIAFYALQFIGADKALAGVVCGIIVLLSDAIWQRVLSRLSFGRYGKLLINSFLNRSRVTQTFENYPKDSPYIAIYIICALIVLYAVIWTSSAFVWLVFNVPISIFYFAGIETLVTPPDVFILSAIIVYKAGRLAGARAKHYPRLIVIISVAFANLFGILQDFAFDTLPALSEIIQQPIDPLNYVAFSVISLMIYCVIGVLGVGSGEKNRHSIYLKYLLRSQHENARSEIVDVAYKKIYGSTE